jgi:acetyl esterase/lipase
MISNVDHGIDFVQKIFNPNLPFSEKNLNRQNLAKPLPRPKVNKVIIHFHGGAFIAQSSESAKVYLRRWANELKVPIFSIDYRLVPKNAYPDPVNDAY